MISMPVGWSVGILNVRGRAVTDEIDLQFGMSHLSIIVMSFVSYDGTHIVSNVANRAADQRVALRLLSRHPYPGHSPGRRVLGLSLTFFLPSLKAINDVSTFFSCNCSSPTIKCSCTFEKLTPVLFVLYSP